MRTLLFILAGLFLSGLVTAQELTIPSDKELVQFETKLGTVTFKHKMHADLSTTKCADCHHKLQPGDETVKACSACHGEGMPEAPKVKKAFHTTCIGCHEYTVSQGEEAGPIKKKCKLCHVKAAE